MTCSTNICPSETIDERAFRGSIIAQLKCMCDVMTANLPNNAPVYCNVITKISHGFTVGKIVAPISGVWSLAVANTKGAVIVTKVVDFDTFEVGLSGFLQDVAGIVAGQSYVVSPTVPGTLVAANTLSHTTNQAFKPVGVGVGEGCLIVNMSPAHTYLCDCGLGNFPDA